MTTLDELYEKIKNAMPHLVEEVRRKNEEERLRDLEMNEEQERQDMEQNLNETYEELVKLFRAAGVEEPEHPRLRYGNNIPMFALNTINLITPSTEDRCWISKDDARDLLGSHFERLWLGLGPMHTTVNNDDGTGAMWRGQQFDHVENNKDKLCAILLAMRSKYGGEDGA